jgi:hypothetical protein
LNNTEHFPKALKETERLKVVVQLLYSRFLFQLRGKMIDLLLLFRPEHGKHVATDVSSLEKGMVTG